MQERDARLQNGHRRNNCHRMEPAEKERGSYGGEQCGGCPAAVEHGVHSGGRDQEEVTHHNHRIHGPGVPVQVPAEPPAPPVGEFGKGRINLSQG